MCVVVAAGRTRGSRPQTECSLSGSRGARKPMGKIAVKTSELSTCLNPMTVTWNQKNKSQKEINDVVAIYTEI